eukprot:TRINITY_DN16644_c0_g4_i1.p1 TRINITY_DN16644_c0_g4~~TRINITY_DN16644_c0_g4_i1.p1  ORF type:complete len:459 (+),score=74.71 TRINITY_DN16644_c0_g4_i1:59-1378(+)
MGGKRNKGNHKNSNNSNNHNHYTWNQWGKWGKGQGQDFWPARHSGGKGPYFGGNRRNDDSHGAGDVMYMLKGAAKKCRSVQAAIAVAPVLSQILAQLENFSEDPSSWGNAPVPLSLQNLVPRGSLPASSCQSTPVTMGEPQVGARILELVQQVLNTALQQSQDPLERSEIINVAKWLTDAKPPEPPRQNATDVGAQVVTPENLDEMLAKSAVMKRMEESVQNVVQKQERADDVNNKILAEITSFKSLLMDGRPARPASAPGTPRGRPSLFHAHDSEQEEDVEEPSGANGCAAAAAAAGCEDLTLSGEEQFNSLIVDKKPYLKLHISKKFHTTYWNFYGFASSNEKNSHRTHLDSRCGESNTVRVRDWWDILKPQKSKPAWGEKLRAVRKKHFAILSDILTDKLIEYATSDKDLTCMLSIYLLTVAGAAEMPGTVAVPIA